MKEPQIEATRTFGANVAFGKTAQEYRKHRAGFPSVLFERWRAAGWIAPGQVALDIGTGTGSIALGLAAEGLQVTGLDPARALLDQAAELAQDLELEAEWVEGKAEALPFPDAAFDVVCAGQCWHWFDRPRAAAEVRRVLKPGGVAIIAHFDWLPLPGNVVQATEALIRQANPNWTMHGGTGFYPAWLSDLAQAGFEGIETTSLDVPVTYAHADWRGRIKASAGIKASLSDEAVATFDAELARVLADQFPEDPLTIPHRLWWVAARRAL